MKTFKQYIHEAYRITPRRREVLNRAYREAQIGADVAANNPNGIHGMQDGQYYAAIMTRVNAIRNMGLPQDKRMLGWGNDRSIKDEMNRARSTQQTILQLKKNRIGWLH